MAEVRLEDFELPLEEREYMIMPMRFILNKVLALNNEDFLQFHLLEMQEYRDKDGWWRDGKIPKCFECSSTILEPENLIRYHGVNYDKNCFKTFWYRDGVREEQQGTFKKYFECLAILI